MCQHLAFQGIASDEHKRSQLTPTELSAVVRDASIFVLKTHHAPDFGIIASLLSVLPVEPRTFASLAFNGTQRKTDLGMRHLTKSYDSRVSWLQSSHNCTDGKSHLV
jgi:hypothetical protein